MSSRRPRSLCAAITCMVLLVMLTFAQSRKSPVDVQVPGDKQWTDTGTDLQDGDSVILTALGTLQYLGMKASGPDGLARGFRDLLRILPVNEAGRGALLGRIGDTTSLPFLVGTRKELQVARGGRLFLGVNQMGNESAEGSFQVRIELHGQTAAASKRIDVKMPEISPAFIDRIPRRVNDADGNPGDTTNFLIIGSEDKMKQALQAAGWVLVDKDSRGAVLHAILGSLSKQAYTQLPMSELMLFDRVQDYGYAHAEPFTVVAQRHHFRLWKSEYTLAGKTVFVGAGTHDIGIEKDQRNGKLTHKIDPQVDMERDYIGQSLDATGFVAKMDYYTPSEPVRSTRTATGGAISSDGRVLAILLKEPQEDILMTGFADLFCAVMSSENPDGGDWGACTQYLGTSWKNRLTLGPITNKYRLLIVPGIMNSCVASAAPAFQEGQVHLKEKHDLTVELLAVPNDSSEANAQLIGKYLKDHMAADQRKYIVLGYSKGAPDVQVMLAMDPEARNAVAAFLSVAGAVGGSPIADVLPAQAERYMQQLKFGTCQGDMSTGFKSLQRSVRQEFLQRFPTPFVPTYSLVAESDPSTTSKMLQQAWQLLSAYDVRQDSQLTVPDAIVPGSKFLGSVRADHLAVALPFDKGGDPKIAALMDKNRFPRATLLEALVRYAVQDLARQN